MTTPRLRPTALFALLAAPVMAALLVPTARADDPIRIGVYSPFSGGSSPMGLSMRNGVRLAVQEINAGGGLLGRQVELVERDDQATNERGAQVMQQLLSSEKVVAVLGPTNTGVALASYKYAEAAKVPLLINVSAGAPVNELFKDFPDNYVFGVRGSDTLQTEAIVHAALDTHGFTRVAILADDTNYGQNGRQKLEALLKGRGTVSVYTGKFKLKDTDMTPQLQQARDVGAQVLLVYGIGPELAHIANGMKRIGYQVPMIGGWTLSMSNFIDPAGKNGNGSLTPLTFVQNNPLTGHAKAFVKAYQDSFGVTRIPVAVAAAQGYDSMNLLARAIAQAGSTESARVKAALEGLQAPYEGVIKTYDHPFSPANHEALLKDDVHLSVVTDGQVYLAQ